MFSFEFVQKSQKYIKILNHSSLPALLCDLDFRVFWHSHSVTMFAPHITETYALQTVLSELNLVELRETIVEEGGYQISGLFPFTDIHCNFCPIYDNDEFFAIAVFFLNTETHPTSPDYLSKTHTALSNQLRSSLHEIFSTSEVIVHNADILHAEWVVPHLNKITLHSYQMLRVTNNISSYTRLQNYEIGLQLQAFPIYRWLSKIQTTVQLLADENQIAIDFELPDNELFIPLDIDWFQIAFFNILHNSFYFTKTNNTILVSVKEAADTLMIVVEDHGLGISEETMPYIFKPYFSTAPVEIQTSLGLGLTLAKRIIEAHSGTIEVASEEGVGTSVTISLPSNVFQLPLNCSQGEEKDEIHDRFSQLYIGLTSAVLSPYAEKRKIKQ